MEAIKTDKTPRTAVGHDFDRFCKVYGKVWRAKMAAQGDGRSSAIQLKDETELLIFSSAMKKLSNHGYVLLGLKSDGSPHITVRQLAAYNDRQEHPGIPYTGQAVGWE